MPGMTRLDIPVHVIDDGDFEGVETFLGRLMSRQDGVVIDVPETMVEILDNDCEPTNLFWVHKQLFSFLSQVVNLIPCTLKNWVMNSTLYGHEH